MADEQKIVDVDETSFAAEVLESDRPVLVDFGAKWCGPCRALTPVLERLAAERAETVKVARVDVDDAPALVVRYGIRSTPTVAVFRHGEKTAQHVGLTTKERLLKLLDV